jgi:hypothetical protein
MYCGLLRVSGGGKRNSEGRVNTQGVIVAICGVAPDAFAGGVGRQKTEGIRRVGNALHSKEWRRRGREPVG